MLPCKVVSSENLTRFLGKTTNSDLCREYQSNLLSEAYQALLLLQVYKSLAEDFVKGCLLGVVPMKMKDAGDLSEILVPSGLQVVEEGLSPGCFPTHI